MKRTAIDLFCGAGGLSEGFRQAGFCVLVGNDVDPFARETFEATHPEAVFLPGPIEKLEAADFLRAGKIQKGELGCLIGGPPCQAFSVYNHQRGMHDKRSHLFHEYLRIVKGLAPEWVVMENVTGITSVGDGCAVREIVAGLGELGYIVEMQVLKAERYGVPQERRRIFFVGNRLGIPVRFPAPTHGTKDRPFVTVGDALNGLPKLANGEAWDKPTVKNHEAPKLSAVNLERMKFIPQGGSWRDIPTRLLPAGMKLAKRSDHTKRYGRLSKKGLASTILTKCDPHWGAFIHPDQDRTITVREAARLQSFPDEFVFRGPRTEQYIQVGNAVPPLLGRRVAEALLAATKSSVL